PGVVSLMRLPGLNMMSHNRLVFLASFAILALTGVGLDALLQGLVRWRWWFWLPGGILLGLCLWSVYRTVRLPEPFRTQLVSTVLQGKEVDWIHDLNGVVRAQSSLIQYYATAAVWCGLGVLVWFALRRAPHRQSQLVPFLGLLLVADLIWFAYGRNVQADPALYFPPVPVLQAVAKAAPGRAMGYGCLPAPLS